MKFDPANYAELSFAEIRPLTCAKDVAAVLAAGAANNHEPLFPSHVVTKHGEIIGSVSMNIPLSALWLHTQKATVSDSVKVLAHIEAELRRKLLKSYVVTCGENSPFFPYMKRAGFSPLGSETFFEKDL